MAKWKGTVKNDKTGEKKILHGESKHELVHEVEDMNDKLTSNLENSSTGENAPWTIQQLEMEE